MKLKKLELYGFKSFADRTSFEFEDSLSALVGPNGAGKSNIADAIKWVLGERSARKLRGAEMVNIIFNGSESRKPLNYAEATLTIDNADGWLPVEYDEVSIRRRVDRTGQSEYYLNGQQCRLKDIRDILLDTGIGTSCYSFIEQGQIDELLRADPKQRRVIFEEAAGINRFLEQKKEAERKLERVAANLERLSDIIEEVDHQLRSVKYQAGRARTFKLQSEELQRLRLAHSLHSCRLFEVAAEENARRLEEADQRRAELEGTVRSAERELESARAEREAARDELNLSRQRLTRVEARLESLAREAEANRRRSAEIEQQLGDISRRRAVLSERCSALEDEIGTVRQRLEETAREVEAATAGLDAQKRSVERVRERTRQVEAELEAKKRGAFDLFERESQLRNQLEIIAAERRTAEARLARIRGRRDQLDAELGEAERERAQTEEKLESVQARQASVAGEVAGLKHRLAEAQQRLERVSSELSRVRAELSGKAGRRDVLRDMEQRGEGVRSGARRLVDAGPAGMIGLLGELLDVPLDMAAAVEAILGPLAHAAVFEGAFEAHEALRLLRDEGSGRSDLIVLSNLPAGTPAETPLLSGVRGRLSELVRCPDRVRPAVESLLANAFLVDDEAAARALLGDRLPPDVKLVTPAGECYGADGIWSGGLPETPSLISRRSELAELDGQIRDLQREQASLNAQRQDTAAQVRDLTDRREAAAAQLDLLQRSAGDVRGHLKLTDSRLQELRDQMQLAATEASAITEDIEELDLKKATLQQECETAGRDRSVAELAVEEGRQALSELAQQEQTLNDRAGERVAELARARERQQSQQQLLDRLCADGERARAEQEALQSEQETSVRWQRETEKAAEAARQESQSLKAEKEGLCASLEAGAAAAEGFQQQISDLAERLQAAGERSRQWAEKVHGLQVTQHETNVKLQDLLERTTEDYGVRLRALELEPERWREDSPFLTRQIREWAHQPAPARAVAEWYRRSEEAGGEEEEEQTELISLEEATELRRAVLDLADDESADWERIKRRIAQLKAKVDRIGNVNVAAIRQQEELEVRLQFLTDQKEDLEKARRHEREIIRELSKQSRQRFGETFQQVQGNFQALFRKLFGGGNADIVLDSEEEDILEAGIDIIARPPGKETNSISLLSGGERALTTVALLLAIFQTKPSPFCLLDEVDAPLDDSNVERFLMLLEEFSRDTQFIIVTHNKLTMSVAQVLYGVTMADGVTKKISVKLEEVDEHAPAEHTPRAKAG